VAPGSVSAPAARALRSGPRPPPPQKKDPAAYAKTALCKFYAAHGSCAAGAECRFAHGEEALRPKPRPATPPRAAPGRRALPAWVVSDDEEGGVEGWREGGRGQRERAPAWADDGGDDADADADAGGRPYAAALGAARVNRLTVVAGAAWKTRVCRFWVAGDCVAGGGCSFAHGEAEVRAPAHIEYPPGLGGGGWKKGGGDAARAGPAGDGAPYQPAPPTAKTKTKLCWHHERNGRCSKGDACRFAHGKEDLRDGGTDARARTPPAAAPASPGAAPTPTTAPPRAAPAPPRSAPPQPPPLALDLARGPADPPPSFVCPITGAVMADPVVAADGYTYERGAVEGWLAAHTESPITR